MRDYAKIEPKAWQGDTFTQLAEGASQGAPEGLLVALYLLSSPSSTMLGLFRQSILYMAEETGLGEKGAWKGLQMCIDVGFCDYDEKSKYVWVYEMAFYQIASELKASDKRCIGIQKDYDRLSDNPFLGEFFDKYADAFHLKNRREFEGATQAPYQAPSKPRTGAGTGTGTGKGDVRPSSDTDEKPQAGNRNGHLCRQLRMLNVDAAPHQLQSPDWVAMLEQRTDDDILAVAEIAKAKKPGERISLNYLLPMLREQAPTLNGGPSHATRQGSVAATVAAFTGRASPDSGDGGGEETVIEGCATRVPETG